MALPNDYLVSPAGGSAPSQAEALPLRNYRAQGELEGQGVDMVHILRSAELPGKSSKQFEGYHYGEVDVSFFLSETPPGSGPALHAHPYAEVFVVQEGTLTFVVGDETVEVTGGQIVIAPANIPHRFTNTGASVARHVNIHTHAQMLTTWIEA